MCLHAVSALSAGGTPHVILHSRQDRQAGLRHSALLLHFVVDIFNTLCCVPGFDIRAGVGSNVHVALALSLRVTFDVGVPVLEDKNDDKCGVGICAPREWENRNRNRKGWWRRLTLQYMSISMGKLSS